MFLEKKIKAKRKNCNFSLPPRPCALARFTPSSSPHLSLSLSLPPAFMPLCEHLHGRDEGPHAGRLGPRGPLKGLRGDGEGEGWRRVLD